MVEGGVPFHEDPDVVFDITNPAHIIRYLGQLFDNAYMTFDIKVVIPGTNKAQHVLDYEKETLRNRLKELEESFKDLSKVGMYDHWGATSVEVRHVKDGKENVQKSVLEFSASVNTRYPNTMGMEDELG